LFIVAQSARKKKSEDENFIKTSVFYVDAVNLPARKQEKSKKGLQNGAVSYRI